ncbi:replication-relaxation family protein [Streptomyces sp. NPDC088921]|uniref:replication-relaxation family protein n=1 Tax=unclassified Streptomyces TaxID=2593676 RepID=UPI003415CC0A
MATTEQMHSVIAHGVRIEQTRRRLSRLREEGLIDRITLPQAGRRRVWFPTVYGARLACKWPELRGRRPLRAASDPTAVRLKVGQALTVPETAFAFLNDARRRGAACRPTDWMTEVHHPIGNGEAAIPDTFLYYQRGPVGSDGGPMLRAFVEVDRTTLGPERLAAYARLHSCAPTTPGTGATLQQLVEFWTGRHMGVVGPSRRRSVSGAVRTGTSCRKPNSARSRAAARRASIRFSTLVGPVPSRTHSSRGKSG